MSKHEKTLRRERKKTDRARRLGARFRHPLASPLCGSHIKHGAAALAAAAVIAAGTQAYASPVRIDNPAHGAPGHAHWPTVGGIDFRLNIVEDASQQPGGGFDPAVFVQTVNTGAGYSQIGGNGEIQVGGYGDYFAVGVLSGDLIPSGPSWGSSGMIYYTGLGSELAEGQDTYLGVRFDLGSGWQYGWIGGVRSGMELETFAWGYETTPGVPIEAGVPEPGSLALLAFGAAAALRKRRTA